MPGRLSGSGNVHNAVAGILADLCGGDEWRGGTSVDACFGVGKWRCGTKRVPSVLDILCMRSQDVAGAPKIAGGDMTIGDLPGGKVAIVDGGAGSGGGTHCVCAHASLAPTFGTHADGVAQGAAFGSVEVGAAEYGKQANIESQTGGVSLGGTLSSDKVACFFIGGVADRGGGPQDGSTDAGGGDQAEGAQACVATTPGDTGVSLVDTG